MGSQFNGPEMILCLIDSMRIEENISMAQMTYGLCDKTLPGKVINGQNRKLDKLLIDAFYQRLGKNLRNFEALLDADEYSLFEGREAFRDAFAKNDIEGARAAVKRYAALKICEKSHLHRQIALMFELCLMQKEHDENKKILAKAKEAIELTIPEFELEKLKDYLYTEVELILLNIILRTSSKLYGDDYVYPFYEKVYEIYQSDRYAENEQVHRFAPLIYPLAILKLKKREFDDAALISDRMVKNLVSDNKIKYVSEFLKIKSEAEAERIFPADFSEEKKERIKKGIPYHRYSAALSEVLKKYQPEWSPDEDIQIYWEYMILPVGKIVKQRRIVLGLSQDDLSMHNGVAICSIDTVSRLENGKHSVSWDVERKILGKLKLMPERFHREFMTDSYDDIKVLKEFINAQAAGDLEEEKKRFNDLKNRHQKTLYPQNEQYIAYSDIRLKLKSGEFKGNLADEYKRILDMTMPGGIDKSGGIGEIYPFNTESIVIIALIREWFRQGENEKAFLLCNSFLEKYEELGRFSNTFNNAITNIERLLSSELGNIGRFEESDEIAGDSMRKCFLHDKLELWSSNIYCLAWNNGADQKKEKDKQAELRASFVLAKLQNKKRFERIVENQCNKFYSDEILRDLK
ncbi:MAG: helix-turn-helix domain-containing protein [Lachnospiraceae bacterium]|nr:helix-turn-helix domain-containing protein [Lachnospiraceae bacterium]